VQFVSVVSPDRTPDDDEPLVPGIGKGKTSTGLVRIYANFLVLLLAWSVVSFFRRPLAGCLFCNNRKMKNEKENSCVVDEFYEASQSFEGTINAKPKQ
jgi:hypothetical protein